MIGRNGELVAPFTLAGQPMDAWDKMQFVGSIDKRRRQRLREAAAETAITTVRIIEHSESDELHTEGEQ